MTYFTVRQIAEGLRVNQTKVIGWIHSGELVAMNVSGGTKPRWRIKQEEFDCFMLRRTKQLRVERKRKQFKDDRVIQFFPER